MARLSGLEYTGMVEPPVLPWLNVVRHYTPKEKQGDENGRMGKVTKPCPLQNVCDAIALDGIWMLISLTAYQPPSQREANCSKTVAVADLSHIRSASEMTCIVSGGALNSTHSLVSHTRIYWHKLGNRSVEILVITQ